MKENNKKFITGLVISTAMRDALVVSVERKKMNSIYKKSFRVNKKIKAVAGDFDLSVGDIVKISEIRPMSKDIHFKVISKEGK
ncbi:MAG: small subunit ribosomal protein S17 [Candidatus Berkelbacteria bacterium Athens1014_28]|uniref:Small subunit ribosomal protein S17 n=1 Tax=Candidatus Berkelbacteria bacterium Athens1014_28 TaxID=2017145 RepID=A0A554LQY6_9BACT|nr:MAG: small subunit ribosomal protein S17 [Candidatus Berkelbacteria bacterium Athens1014_28]